MPATQETKPVEDSVPKVNDEIAVGENLGFQRKWWKFEQIVWVLLTLIVIADFLGVFGRGYFANARRQTSDGSMDVKYERVQRMGAPSVMSVRFGPSAVKDGKAQLWVSESLVKALGLRRMEPTPLQSVVSQGGVTYTFAATPNSVPVDFALQPAKIGNTPITLRVPGAEQIDAQVFVMP